jgi:2-polyprenyl-6-methoxyphenol hydroxylase-like FAD-dependent oxidoreductase
MGSAGLEKMAHLGRHVIVIGASMGGLLAGRALADYYDEVTLIDRDALPLSNEPRKGVPQGRHTHGLLARGREVLEQLFPGFTAEMVADGAVAGDIADATGFIYEACIATCLDLPSAARC